jgi:hypothetical protein
LTPAACVDPAVLRFDILGCRVGIATRSRLVQRLVRRLYGNYTDTAAGQPETVLQINTISQDGNRLWTLAAERDPISSDANLGSVLNRLEYEICRRVIERRRDLIMLHGALVSRDGAALFISGESGAGKTTLSMALSTRGFHVETDDVALFEASSTTFHPIPRCFHLDSRSKRLLRETGVQIPEASGRHSFVTPADLQACGSRGPTPDTLIALSPARSDSPALVPLTQAEMTGLLMRESAWGRQSGGEVLTAVIRLTRRARCYQLTMGSLDASVNLLDELCRRSTPV